MAWKTQFTETRPSTSVNFYIASDDAKNHIQTTYRNTGKMTSRNSVFSGDNLKRTRTLIFNSEASRAEYILDSVITNIRNSRTTHNASNNITLVIDFDGEE